MAHENDELENLENKRKRPKFFYKIHNLYSATIMDSHFCFFPFIQSGPGPLGTGPFVDLYLIIPCRILFFSLFQTLIDLSSLDY